MISVAPFPCQVMQGVHGAGLPTASTTGVSPSLKLGSPARPCHPVGRARLMHTRALKQRRRKIRSYRGLRQAGSARRSCRACGQQGGGSRAPAHLARASWPAWTFLQQRSFSCSARGLCSALLLLLSAELDNCCPMRTTWASVAMGRGCEVLLLQLGYQAVTGLQPAGPPAGPPKKAQGRPHDADVRQTSTPTRSGS